MPVLFGKKQKCPDCGAIAFGSLSIGQTRGGQSHLELACEKCGTSYTCDLPKIDKKILYLDQFAISNMMRSKETDKNDDWSTLFDRLKFMVQRQRIICPTSWEHREESEFSRDRCDRLIDTCRKLAMGNRFRGFWNIQNTQIYEALKAFMKGEEATWHFKSRDAFRDDPNAWHDYLAIDVTFDAEPDQIADRRKNKEALQKTMEALYTDPNYLSRSFEEYVRLETDGFAHGLIGTHDKEQKELLEIMCGQKPPDPLALMSSPGTQAVQMVLRTIQQESQADDHNKKAREFFFSSQFATIPAVRINAIMRAAMALKSRDSSRRPKPGDQYDLTVICSYMPYCDAILIDREMHSFATDGNAGLDKLYGTRLFSARTLPELYKWLEEVEASFPAQHKETVSDVYEEQFGNLELHKGRNLFEARKSMFSLRPTHGNER